MSGEKSGLMLALLILAISCGCGGDSVATKPAGKVRRVSSSKNAKPRPRKTSSTRKTPRTRGLGLSLDPGPGRTIIGAGGGTGGGAQTRLSDAAQPLFAVIKDSVDYRPTLVVWILDASPSARPLLRDFRGAVDSFLAQMDVPASGGDAATGVGKDGAGKDGTAGDADGRGHNNPGTSTKSPSLLHAVVSFGDKTVIHQQPTGDRGATITAVEKVGADSESGTEYAFAAVEQVLQEFLSWRTKKQHEVILAVITDETGDDEQALDRFIQTPKKFAIPVYVVGYPVLVGQVAAADQSSEQVGPPNKRGTGQTTSIRVRRGPESQTLEWVQLDFAASEWPQILSGFGPFGWERLCRASGGRFLPIQQQLATSNSARLHAGFEEFGSFSESAKLPKRADKAAGKGASAASSSNWHVRYQPDYVSTAEYQKIVSGNKACQALTQAAALGRFPVLESPRMEFVKTGEAQLKRDLDQAQRPAARLQPRFDRLVGVLEQGESDRDALRSLRWKAGYDLALGRAMAAQVRIQGYNEMLAALERGKVFQNANSTTWVLVPDQEISTGTRLRNRADRALQYLRDVARDHAGTPWAAIATRELKTPLGWKWEER